MKRFGAIALAGGLLLGAATTASAVQVRNDDARVEARQHDKASKQAMREQIRAKHREYRELRKADDPRAAAVKAEVRAMKDEWKRLYGEDEMHRRDGKAHGKHKQKQHKELKQHKQKQGKHKH